jgi:3-methylfumaryl-CoA hydratase
MGDLGMQRQTSAIKVDQEGQVADDVCSLPLVRRLAAMLDQDPALWKDGDALPRGWHVLFFAVDMPQSGLRTDGVSGLGIDLPDVGLPRLMMGGKRVRFDTDLPIGAKLLRASRVKSIVPKEGKSGKLAVVTIEHNISLSGARNPAIIEECDYVFREATEVGNKPPQRDDGDQAEQQPSAERIVIPDETLLFRYSALTYNAHRIHFDHPYATAIEEYPDLVVNGGLTTLLLLEFFKAVAGRQPSFVSTRNVRPLYCGRPMRLKGKEEGASWALWAENEQGRSALEARAE